jgi:lysophospholipase L1-like esterase
VLQPADFSRLAATAGFAEMERSNRERAATDWAGLCRHRAANEALAPGKARVVFIGDSITENWLMADPEFFSGAIVNRGIGAQTSAQMLLRFRADVVALRPAVVHILAGTNDVAGNNGPIRPRDFQNNIESMVEIARANGIRVVIGSIPPAAAFSWQPALRPAPRIAALNEWLRAYAAHNRLRYVDYHAALRGPAGELQPALGNDGVHPHRDAPPGRAGNCRLARRRVLCEEPEYVGHGAHDDGAVIQAGLHDEFVRHFQAIELFAEAARTGDQRVLVAYCQQQRNSRDP